MMNPTDFLSWMQKAQAQTELILGRFLPQPSAEPARLHDAMRYVTLGGGKRVRPLLAFAAAKLGSANDSALQAAIASVEMIHVYSLVHDDMPPMDNDSLRRGKATCHIAYDEATALLVGDALQSLAFDLLSRPNDFDAIRQLKMVQTLATASGSLGMAGGQAIDLSNVGLDLTQAELENMHRLKTGALIAAAARLGALSCPDLDETALSALDVYAQNLGLAFQVIDDVLDCEQDTATLGKTAGKDADNNKPTYVKLMGLDAAKTYAHNLVNTANEALQPFAEKADLLKYLANYVVQRNA